MNESSESPASRAHGPNREFWEERFQSHKTPWERGAVHPQLTRWMADGSLEAVKLGGQIAVPGCGTGFEVVALAGAGFDVVAIDYAVPAIEMTRQRLRAAGLSASCVQADVLAWQPDAPLAAVYEQTCLCALHPDHWVAYAAQLHRWLRPGGQLFALFMQTQREGAAKGFIEGPPYHCNIHAMRALFAAPLWDWPKPPYDSVAHPMGSNELAVVLTRR
ncbi:MAG: TPMT family class I SAM-dependent methyltransferase [Rhizobacter sp.]|nr:methyltransferase domain-containing protein [Burkholderiaceae bacterium]MCO5125348.1 TPMT family class I SAM-dependent methyltransferase [Rhizobacter sp.]